MIVSTVVVTTVRMRGVAVANPPPTRWASFKEEPTPAPSSIAKMLGTLAITAGVIALGAYVFDAHGHTCESCGEKWTHLGAFNVGDPTSHTCKRCGTVQWWKDGIPHVFRGALHQAPQPVVSNELMAKLSLLSKKY